MLILNCWHPDVLEFISPSARQDHNANISVGITDTPMDAVHLTPIGTWCLPTLRPRL
jgi:ribonucleotide reductase alpha subunit